jgi:acid phosphatase class B
MTLAHNWIHRTLLIALAVAPLTGNAAPRAFKINCTSSSGEAAPLEITAASEGFEVTASSGKTKLFQVAKQLPSLNARVEDGASDAVDEFVDFNPTGLETVPVDSKNKLEIDLKAIAKVKFAADGNQVELTCRPDKKALLKFLKLEPAKTIALAGVKAVGFDIDDALMFTTPTFVRGFVTGGSPKPDDVLFWTHTNACDGGCEKTTIKLADGSTKELPANVASTPKAKVLELIRKHQKMGHKVYAITARPDINGDPLRDYLAKSMGIARENIFFEPDMDLPGNPAGKQDRIASLGLNMFYGDSDSDITDAMKVKGVKAVRILRSPKSSNRKAGELNKYHPGYYGETILAETY